VCACVCVCVSDLPALILPKDNASLLALMILTFDLHGSFICTQGSSQEKVLDTKKAERFRRVFCFTDDAFTHTHSHTHTTESPA